MLPVCIVSGLIGAAIASAWFAPWVIRLQPRNTATDSMRQLMREHMDAGRDDRVETWS